MAIPIRLRGQTIGVLDVRPQKGSRQWTQDELAIHLNFLQEAIQPEGAHDARGCLDALQELCSGFRLPVIVKETGSGISAATAKVLWDAGVKASDVGGYGGTDWAAIEGLRSGTVAGEERTRPPLFEVFEEWGIPTVVSICAVAGTGGPVIASGGIRSGLDMAKAMVLGADLCGVALPFLAPAMKGEKELLATISAFLRELRVAMFLSGAKNTAALKEKRPYITGVTREMIVTNWRNQ